MYINSNKISVETGLSHEIIEFTIKDVVNSYNLNSEIIKDFTYFNYQKLEDGSYDLTKDLMVLLIFNLPETEKIMEYRKLYIAKFNETSKKLLNNKEKLELDITFTNLVYSTLYGYDAYKLRMIHNLPKGENIRPWLSDEDVKVVDKMEQEVGTLISYGIELKVIRSMISKKHGGSDKRELVLLNEKRK